MDDWPQLPIGEVARRAGVATSSIRYYESIGLLAAPARLHGQRRYGTDVLGRLAFIGVAQSAGSSHPWVPGRYTVSTLASRGAIDRISGQGKWIQSP